MNGTHCWLPHFYDFLVFCQGRWQKLYNDLKPVHIILNAPWLSGVLSMWQKLDNYNVLSISSLLMSSQTFHDFLVLDKLAKVGYKVVGNELLYDSHHFPFNHLGWLCPWGERWWTVRTKVSAIIMMRIGRQRDVSEEICAYERRCLTCVNHDSSCIQCITTYTSLKMVMTRAYPVWYSE